MEFVRYIWNILEIEDSRLELKVDKHSNCSLVLVFRK
jgi:hypothetical protein